MMAAAKLTATVMTETPEVKVGRASPSAPRPVLADDRLYAWVWLDPADPPREVVEQRGHVVGAVSEPEPATARTRPNVTRGRETSAPPSRVWPSKAPSSAWPMTLLILCAPVWFRSSRLK